jgi:O-antigen ligase
MTSRAFLFSAKAAFLAANAALSGMLCFEWGTRGRLFALAVALVAAACCKWRGLLPHLLAAFGAGMVFFGFQPYASPIPFLHFLTSLIALAVLVRSARPDLGGQAGTFRTCRPGAWPERQSLARRYGPLRLWLLGFVGVMAAGLPLLPMDLYAAALGELGLQGFVRLAGYAVAASPFYALTALVRLLLFALLAWELSRLPEEEGVRPLLLGMAASVPAAAVFGLGEFFLAKGKAYALNDRLTSLFLNPGWFGEYACVAFPFLLPLARRRGARALFALLAVTLAAMLLTMARAAWFVSGALTLVLAVSFAGGFDLYALNARRMIRGAALGAACAAVVALGAYWALSVSKLSLLNFPLAQMINERLERFAETPRPTVFKSGVLIGLESPAAGMGYETYAWRYPRLMAAPSSLLAREVSPEAEVFEATHNLFIQIFAGGGLLALAAWLLLAARAAQLAARRHRLRADALSLAALLSLGAFHLFGLFQEMIYVPAVWLAFFALLAFCLRAEDDCGGWTADFTAARAGRGVALAVLAALCVNLSNAGFSATAARLGLASYGSTGAHELDGFFGPEMQEGGPAMWSTGASSFALEGPGPWTLDAGAPHPDLAARPVVLSISAGGRELARAVFDEKRGRLAQLTIPPDAARPGQRVYVRVSRIFYPMMSGVKDSRPLAAWMRGPGITR